MQLSYTQHAIARLAKRGILTKWVEFVVERPALLVPDAIDGELEHRVGVIPELGGRALRVIVSKNQPARVVTAYFDRKMKGML